MQAKRTRLLLLVSSALIIVFFLGYIMGEAHYKSKVIDALKGNSMLDIAKACDEWKQGDTIGNRVTDPVFFLAMLKIHAENGNLEGVKYNIGKIVSLLGK